MNMYEKQRQHKTDVILKFLFFEKSCKFDKGKPYCAYIVERKKNKKMNLSFTNEKGTIFYEITKLLGNFFQEIYTKLLNNVFLEICIRNIFEKYVFKYV